ncbi:hypothetical protein Ancab_014447 [Ancistrocladus abbreviatus]
MFKFWGSQDEESQNHPTESWYPPSAVNPTSSSQPLTTSGSSSGSYNVQSPSHVSPAEAAGIIASLKNKSVDELRKLLTDKQAYNKLVHSLEQVKTQNNVRDELRKETIQLARENFEKEPQIMELRIQCRIIRTTELASAQETLNDLQRQKDEILKCYSPASLLQRLQEAMNKMEEESETLHSLLLNKEIELGAFVQKYKKLRNMYHHRALTHLASKACPVV